MQLLAFFSPVCRIPGCLAHIPKKNANFATLTRPFLPFQTGGQFLYKPMNNMTEKQLKTEKQQKAAAEEFARKWEGRGYIESTHVLIEQKSLDKDLLKPIRQSDGSLLTPCPQFLRVRLRGPAVSALCRTECVERGKITR